MPVLKKRHLPPSLRAFGLDDAFGEPHGRIPGARVNRVAGREPEPAATPARGVLRGARMGAQPVEMEVFLPDPAFALPPLDDEPERTPEPAAAPEPERSAEERIAAALAEQEAAFEMRLAEQVEAARADGFAAGDAAARAELEADFADGIESYGEDLARLGTLWRDFLDRAEPLLAALAFEIAEAVLEAPLPAPLRAVSERALTEAVETLAASAPLDIALHPVDYLRLQEEGVVEHLDRLHPDLRWSPNTDLVQGDWTAQAPDAAIRRLRDELLATLKRRLGLLALAERKPD